MKPEFIILAGPNGAGKSTYGHMYVPLTTPIFNGDLVFAELIKQYPHIEPESLGGGVAAALEKARDIALAEKAGFAFESNFSNNMAMEITRIFKEAKYETTLIYFGLSNVKISAFRVDKRVELGGHNVPTEIIKYNLEEGIKRVKAHLADFNNILFVDTSMPFSAPVIAYCNKITGVCETLDPHIDWFNKNFKDSLEQDFLQYRKEQGNDKSPELEH